MNDRDNSNCGSQCSYPFDERSRNALKIDRTAGSGGRRESVFGAEYRGAPPARVFERLGEDRHEIVFTWFCAPSPMVGASIAELQPLARRSAVHSGKNARSIVSPSVRSDPVSR